MTSRELEILNTIYRLGGQCSMRKITKETCLSPDYASLISKELLKQKLLKKTANNVFILTTIGRSLLERSRDGSEGGKTPTLIEVSRSFENKVKLPSFEPEINFINREFIPDQPRLIEHNLGKDQITEMADAQSIQKSLKRLTFVDRKRSKMTG
ncbi:MAG: hypothetical protein NTV77_03590 [Candidatus Azambacteria bacterium]|nr:hypothetical protein [Candidatus Azambacteria bacterium]